MIWGVQPSVSERSPNAATSDGWGDIVDTTSEPGLPAPVGEDEVRGDRQPIALADERLDLMQPIAVDHDQIACRVVDDRATCMLRRRHVVVFSVPEGVPDAQPAA